MKQISSRLAVAAGVVLAMMTLMGGSVQAASRVSTGSTATVWIQTMDSCQQAIPGAVYTVTGGNTKITTAAGPGSKPHTVASAHGSCPLQRGSCVTTTVGCVSVALPVPTSGSVTYTIAFKSVPSAYAPCTGGSACRSEIGSVTVTSAGNVSATVTNIYPDGFTVTWPKTGAAYTGASTDPIVFHAFGIGNISCDGDNDADDHLTGSPSSHCDSDKDKAHK